MSAGRDTPRKDEPLSPACMKCEQITGKSTCFPGPCVFYRERNTPGTKAHSVAVIDRIRRGARDTVHASCDTHPKGGDGEATAPFMSGAVPNEDSADAQTQPPQPTGPTQ